MDKQSRRHGDAMKIPINGHLLAIICILRESSVGRRYNPYDECLKSAPSARKPWPRQKPRHIPHRLGILFGGKYLIQQRDLGLFSYLRSVTRSKTSTSSLSRAHTVACF